MKQWFFISHCLTQQLLVYVRPMPAVALFIRADAARDRRRINGIQRAITFTPGLPRAKQAGILRISV
jgi:hypothetical protein